MTVNDDKCLSSDTSTCSFTAILSFHHFIHLHRFHLVQLILRGHEECSCISPFQSTILEVTGSSTKIVGTKKWKFHSSISIHLVFRCVSIRVFLLSKVVDAVVEHHTSIFGFCAAASPKVQRLSNYKLVIWKQHRSLSSKLPVTMKDPNVFKSIFDKKWVDESRTAKLRDANTDALGRTAGLNGTWNHCKSYL